MRRLYDERMRLTGQNGLSDYDVGFTNFLYTFELSSTARQDPPPAGAVRARTAGRGERPSSAAGESIRASEASSPSIARLLQRTLGARVRRTRPQVAFVCDHTQGRLALI
jgi:hypothetical protein